MNELVTYALIESYRQGNKDDYIDAFLPFVLSAFDYDEWKKSISVKNILVEYSNLEIPNHVLDTILKRSVRRKLLIKNHNNQLYKLSGEGSKFLDSLESDRDVERRINSIIEDIVGFFSVKGIVVDESEANEIITNFEVAPFSWTVWRQT